MNIEIDEDWDICDCCGSQEISRTNDEAIKNQLCDDCYKDLYGE